MKESSNSKRIYLSPPHLGTLESELVKEAFDSNWIAPLGPHVDAFEREFSDYLGVAHAAALSSGTAALHLSMRLLNVQPGDEVICSTFSFCSSANAILYEGGRPVFIDSETDSWNIDPDLLEEELHECARRGKLPKAVIAVDLYGQAADYDRILPICRKYEIPLVEDAAEALGASYGDRKTGTFGKVGIFSFNGNKIITTSGGGMLVSEDRALVERARFLATQARDPAPHYQHSTIGYNYRLSNVLAAIGRGQLRVLPERIEARRRNFEFYHRALSRLPGIGFMPEAGFGRCTRWLTCITIQAESFGATPETVRLALEDHNIEARPVWKPLHLQPVFSGFRVRGGRTSEKIFATGLCLPSGSSLSSNDLERIVEIISGTQNGTKKNHP
jgi:dTDP-4-amino-4,6-dideoxygalactose transaminase